MIKYWSKTMRSLETLKQFIRPFFKLGKCITYLKFGRLHSWYAVKGRGFGGNLQKVREQSDTECKHKQIDMLAFQNN